MVESTKFITHMDILRMPTPEEKLRLKLQHGLKLQMTIKKQTALLLFLKGIHLRIF